jgi:oligopeptide/dipeptide ABC transporter ATP-binding protein
MKPLLTVSDLTVSFRAHDSVVRAVDRVGYSVRPGRALAIVGESGSGKTVSVRALLRLLPRTARTVGSAFFEDRDLLSLSERGLREIRGARVGMVFQNPMNALNPTVPLARQLAEPLLWHGICGKAEAKARAVAALADVGIPEPERRVRDYPFQLSGGMRQRAMIAMAVIANPALLIADEPTTAVDVTIQRQILDLLAAYKRRGMAMIVITHDLGVARAFCDDVLVMYSGRVMERGPTTSVLNGARHPYTRGLLASTLEVGDRGTPVEPIPGTPPDLADIPAGCPFQPRCAVSEAPRCLDAQELRVVGPGREVACWREHEHAR